MAAEDSSQGNMKRDADFFETEEPHLIYIARRLSDATRLEELLNAAGIDYGAEPDYYTAGTIFRTTRIGAFFYVREQARAQAVALLLENGYVPARPEVADPSGTLGAAESGR